MLENEIVLTDNQVKILLELFNKVYEDENLLNKEHKELKNKLKDCIYGC